MVSKDEQLEKNNKEHQEKMAEQIIDIRCFIAGTIEYRREQGKRMEELIHDVRMIQERLNQLPCNEGEVKYKALAASVNVLWVFLSAIVITIVGMWLKQ